ncbi:MAG: LLM class flavin-dependent oxidoreductase [Acidobacteriaceae bacterium]|nr:LLM class flavin-dependent oxidoreductase [Acidobacteriaceae bacterium]
MSAVQPTSISPPSNLVDALRFRSEKFPNRAAYVFLRDSDGCESVWTYQDLDLQARKIAAWLQSEGLQGRRILLVFPQGLEYIAAFLGCLYAGAIAVPVYPPHRNRRLHRISAIVQDCQPAVALASRALLPKIQAAGQSDPQLASLRCCLPETLPDDLAASWTAPRIEDSSLAFLQYTSGSTAEPKGVMISHRNLICNEKMIQQAFGVGEDSVIVGWLPLFHDMGLIGNVLQALWSGARCVLFSPASFLHRPVDWLNAITRYRATISGGPDFAYRLCTTKVTAEQRSALDLTSWQIAFTGAEPVRAQTITEFSEKFAPCGFNANAFFPCYGLAEATLFVSGRTGNRAHTADVSSRSLARGEFVLSTGDDNLVQTFVSNGAADARQQLAIIDPDTLQPCPAGRIGEIWISGENVARGYWNNPRTSEAVFQAFTAHHNGPYLRSGDLGYLLDDQLFITGRIKDLIIVRGRNVYPQDLEFAVSRSHPAFANAAGAAFAVDAGAETQVVLVQEVPPGIKSADTGELLRAAVRAVAEEQEVQLETVVLVRAGSLPKTSSGKIRRHECRRQFLNSELKPIATTAGEQRSGDVGNDGPAAGFATGDSDEIETILTRMAAKILGLNPARIDPDTPLLAYGLDSLQAAELNSGISEAWRLDLPPGEWLDAPAISSLAALVRSSLNNPASDRGVVVSKGTHRREWPLSYGQRALFYLYKLAPQAAAYHIPVAVRIIGELDRPAMTCAIDDLVRRHESLRSVFTSSPNGMVQCLSDNAIPSLCFESAESLTDPEIRARVANEANRVFDLEQGPLFRATLFSRSPGEHVLLLVFHHIITDLASLTLLFEDFRQLYSDHRAGRDFVAPNWPYRYADFVEWQQQMLAGKQGQKLRQYWTQQLSGGLPILKLPTDRPRPPVQTYRGAALNFRLDDAVTSGVHALAKAQLVSLYTLLAAAFIVLLHRYTSQTEILLGSPVAGRARSSWSGLPGYLVNQIVLRARVSGAETFQKFLAHVRRLVVDGLAHQDYPLALVAEDLRLERDPSYPPLFQVMFSLQRSGPGHDENSVALALREPGLRVDFDHLEMESFAFDQDSTQLDLTLAVAQIGDTLAASLQYNTDLFDRSTMARMGDHFRMLLADIVAHPDCRLEEFQLMRPEEQKCLLSDWNATHRDYPRQLCIHHLFSARAVQRNASIAVIGGDEELTYGELDRRSDELALCLQSKGAGPGHIVGLCADRRASLLTGVLGILKSGAAYLPLEPISPDERIRYMLQDAGVGLVVTQQAHAARLRPHASEVVCLDQNSDRSECARPLAPAPQTSDALAYLMYTSGSTGKPKAVMVSHRSVVNFFCAMDQRIGCAPEDTMLAVTSISFDISILELLWSLTRGAKLVLADPLVAPAPPRVKKIEPDLDYSLFYFASSDEDQSGNKYELLMEGAKFADENGFAAVWTPERHFHPFGGLYPNPAVTGAALAAVTRRIHVRAGSVVLPLHNVIRVAEEWSVVDNLSLGRTGLAFASGWHADDFSLAPQNYADRKALMFQAIEAFRRLWRGEAITVQSGSGKEIQVRVFPKPFQPAPQIWITAAGSADTFVRAGQIGAHVLTHLLGQSIEDVSEKIRLYRDSLEKHGHDRDAGRVTLMLHTFLGDDRGKIKDQVRAPFTRYLASSVDLIKQLAQSANLPLDFERMSPRDMDDLLAFAFDRYFETSAMFGTVHSCQAIIEKIRSAGVNEVACLIDFGVENRAALSGLTYIPALKRVERPAPLQASRSIGEMASTYRPTLMQCTPAVMKLVSSGPGGLASLGSLRALMIGGESLAPAFAREITEKLSCRLVNMYGPTETTIWSSTAEIAPPVETIHIGKPIANTTMYILDRNSGVPVPIGVIGELFIGGDGVAQGYLNRPDLTAQKFLPDPFSATPGLRMYRTGDLARYLADGNIELLGRDDNQVKIRGVRIELGEIEAALVEHPAVRQVVVAAQKETGADEKRLVAYIVPSEVRAPAIAEIRSFLKSALPDAMIPSAYVFLPELPLTLSGKVNRNRLPQPKAERAETGAGFAAPTSEYEIALTSIWKRVLNLNEIGIDDNFFDLGGHSLRLVQVHGELTGTLRQNVPLIKLLEHPTIRALAAYLAAETVETKHDNGASRAMTQQAAILRQQQKSMLARRALQN